MYSFIELEDSKKAYINIKMEDTYLFMNLGKGMMTSDIARTGSQIDNYDHMNDNLFKDIDDFFDKRTDYEWIFDCEGIKEISINARNQLFKKFEDIPNKKICNYDNLSEIIQKEYADHGFKTEEEDNYTKGLEKYLLRYIKSNCLKPNVTSNTGEVFENYINAKAILVNNDILNIVAYCIAYSLYNDYQESLKNYSLFCHTLNGACLASAISLLLGMDVIYSDRINSTRIVRKLFMSERLTKGNKCFVVTDLVCQGHELLRARDLVTILGGRLEKNIGLIDVEIENVDKAKDDYYILKLDKFKKEFLGYKVSIKS